MKCSLLSSILGLALSGSISAGPTELKLEPYANPRGSESLTGLSASLFIEAVQPDSSSGIEFSLVIENTGTTLISLDHEWRNVRLFLRNKQGIDVDVPDPLRLGDPEKPGPGGTKPPSPEQWAQAVARRSLKYITDESPKADNEQRLGSVANQPDLFHIYLGPGRKESFRFRVDVIMGDPERYWAEIEKGAQAGRERAARGEGRPVGGLGAITPPTVIPIPAGEYTLAVSISLWGDKALIGRFSSERIKVRLGPPPAAAGTKPAP